MWPETIENSYRNWIQCKELFHPIDFKYFANFLWACIDDPNGSPNEVEFRERLARDRKLKPDEQGYPHPMVAKAVLLFTYLPDFWKYRPSQPTEE